MARKVAKKTPRKVESQNRFFATLRTSTPSETMLKG